MTLSSRQHEAKIVTSIIKAIQERYPEGDVFKTHGGMYQTKGYPDLLFWCRGKSFGLEVKRPGEPYGVTELQRYRLDKLASAGVHTAVVHSPEEALRFIIETLNSD